MYTVQTNDSNNPGNPPMPGMDMIGRGIYIRPQQPFELKEIVFPQTNPKTYHSKETGQNYAVPAGYEVNDSPPMPAGQALNQVCIEESWERFEKQNSLDIGLAVGTAPFSLNVNAAQTAQLRSEEEAYYALRSSFIPLWALYIPDGHTIQDSRFGEVDIPAPYAPQHRRAYENFFERYGTHYVKRVWVGGKATLAFTIAKSSSLSKEDIKAGLKASQAGLGGTTLNAAQQEQKSRLQNNSECTMLGKGGDEVKLAALSTLDEAKYNEWLATIKDNPQVIELDACGIWTLIDDPAKALALQTAYTEATVFTPVRVSFNYDRRVHMFRGDRYFSYGLEHFDVTEPAPVCEAWPQLRAIGFEQVDAAFMGKYLTGADGTDLSRKLYLFNRDQYARVDMDTKTVDPGYPKAIAEGWPGVIFERIDATLSVANDAVYFFRGNQYIRFNMANHHADPGYPDSVSKRWVGLTFDRVDAAVYWGNAKVYFFRDNQHIRYDMVSYRADPGYPKSIIGNYVEDWKFFD